jgi:tRNA pseudouridine55 synthase
MEHQQKNPKSEASGASGLLVVNKPLGLTSYDVVRWAKKILHTRKIGHAGTLDPLASGVLVLGVERATKLMQYIQAYPKVYEAEVTFHATSATDDAEGPLEPNPCDPFTKDDLRAALQKFEASFEQLPPAFSAKKIKGKRAHEMARAGERPLVKPARVTGYQFTVDDVIIDADGKIQRAQVTCCVGSGFYVRSMARDVGAALGGGAYLTALKRTRIGPFTLEQAAEIKLLDAPADGKIAAPESSDESPQQTNEVDSANSGETPGTLKESAKSDGPPEDRPIFDLDIDRPALQPASMALVGFPWVSVSEQEATDLFHGKKVLLEKERWQQSWNDPVGRFDLGKRLGVACTPDGPICLAARQSNNPQLFKIEQNLRFMN